jgi:hypothetical protein
VVASNAILSAIAYTDALTAAYGGRVNQQDHAAAVKLLRDTLGKSLPDAQERRLARLLGRKDEVQYGARQGRMDDASQVVDHLNQFGGWTKDMLAARSVVIALWTMIPWMSRPGRSRNGTATRNTAGRTRARV